MKVYVLVLRNNSDGVYYTEVYDTFDKAHDEMIDEYDDIISDLDEDHIFDNDLYDASYYISMEDGLICEADIYEREIK